MDKKWFNDNSGHLSVEPEAIPSPRHISGERSETHSLGDGVGGGGGGGGERISGVGVMQLGGLQAIHKDSELLSMGSADAVAGDSIPMSNPHLLNKPSDEIEGPNDKQI